VVKEIESEGMKGVWGIRWMRDSAIIALGIRMIQRPEDLSNLNMGDVEFGKGAM
jgi:hypothetical protein